VIFIITAPLLAYAIRLDLPDVKAAPVNSRSEAIKLSIDAEGRVFWNADLVDAKDLAARFAAAASKSPQPDLHLRADKATRFERVAEVMAAAQDAGLTKIGFVTEPQASDSAKAAKKAQ
jgi:biopolymer transport protein ExbD